MKRILLTKRIIYRITAKIIGAVITVLLSTGFSYSDCTVNSSINASDFLATYGTCEGTLTIPGGIVLTMNTDLTIPSSINVIHIEDGGQIYWPTNNRTLFLAENTAIVIDNTTITSGSNAAISGEPNCSNTKRINIGTVEYSACTGGGNVCIIFEQVVAAGGTIRVEPEILVPGAIGNMICDEPFELDIELSGFQFGEPTYVWTQISGPGTSTFDPSNTSENPTVTVSEPGTYVYEAEVSLPLSEQCPDDYVTATAQVEVVVLPSPEGSIGTLGSGSTGGTIEACKGDPNPDITITNDESEPITVTYNINGGASQSISVDAGSSVNISVPTDETGTFNYNLISISYQSGPTCESNASGTATVIVTEPLANAEVVGTACVGATELELNETGGDAASWNWSSDGSAIFDDNALQRPTITGFTDGETFTVEVTDSDGCTNTAQVILNLVVCCELDVDCPASPVTVECPEDIPSEIQERVTNEIELEGLGFTVNDYCNALYISRSIGSIPSCEGNVEVLYTISDDNGNEETCTVTYTIDYSGALTALPTSTSSTVSCPADATDPGAPATIQDACGRNVVPVLVGSEETPDPVTCEGTVVWTYRYTTCDGENYDWTHTYTIDYSGALTALPTSTSSTVSCPADATDPGAPATIQDACGRNVVPVLVGSEETPDPVTCEGTVVWTYRYTTCDGENYDWTHTYTIDYSGALTALPTSTSSTVSCPADATDPGAPATIQDACGRNVVPVLVGSEETPDPVTCEGTVVWTYRYTTCDGENYDWTHTYTIDYSGALTALPTSTSSTVSCPADATDPGAPATIQDACGRNVVPVLVGSEETPDPVTCEGTVVWTYRYTTCDGENYDWTHTYTIDYSGALTALPTSTSSTVSCPADATDPGAPATIQDACGRNVVPVLVGSEETPDPVTCEGTVVWTYRYTTCDGENYDWTHTYTIDYSGALTALPTSTSSTVSCPADATDPGAPATIQDACGRNVVPVLVGSEETPDPVTCEGTVVWTYRYTTCDGENYDWTHTYTIDYSGALTALPTSTSSTVSCPADATDPGAPATIQDACGRNVVPVLVGSEETPDPVTCEGTVVWTYRYTTCDGENYDWTHTYTIDYSGALTALPTSTSSTVSCPADATDPGAPATIQDACGRNVVPVLVGSEETPDPVTCEGTVVWTYRYTTCDGENYDWTHTYTIDYSGALTALPTSTSSTVSCPADATDPGAPATIQDACGRNVVPVLVGSEETPDPVTCEGTVVWTYRYTTCDGENYDWTHTYTIDYSGALTALPTSTSSTVSCPADATDPGAPATIQDACGRNVVPVLVGSEETPDPVTCEGTVVWTYRYTTCDGENYDWTHTYTIDYSGALTALPTSTSSTVSCPADATDPGAPATIQDACGRNVVPVLVGSEETPDPVTCEGTVVWTYRYTTCDGENYDWTHTYTIDYSGALTALPTSTSSTVSCPADATDPGAPATIQDACGRNVVPVLVGSEETPDPVTCEGTVVWTYRYTTCDGENYDWTHTYTIDYSGALTALPTSTSSTVSCPADATDPGAPATIQDACGRNVVPVLVGSEETPDPVTCEGTVVWTYRYTTCDGENYDWTHTYTIDYSGALTALPTSTSSTVSCPADATDPGAPATIQDACGRNVVPVLVGSEETPDPVTCEGTVVWTYRYTTCDGENYDWTHTYTIDYSGALTALPTSTSSTVSCPADATDPGAPATIQDACGRNVVPVLVGSEETPDPVTCEGTVVWTYRYTTCDGENYDWTHTYTIDYSGALTALPTSTSSTVSCPADATDPGAPATIQDACGRNVVPVLVGSEETPDPVTCEGTVVWTYRYTTCDGENYDWTHTYTIDYSGALTALPTSTSSTVSCPADATDPGAPATIQDACGRNVVPVLVGSEETPDPVTCEGTVVWTYRYTTCDGENYDWTYTYNIKDETAPSIILPAANLDMECFDAASVDAWIATASATDNCDGSVTVSASYDAPADNCDQIVTVTFTAEDNCGNQATATKTFTVNDNTAPVIDDSTIQNLILDCNSDTEPESTGIATATDNCSEATVTYSDVIAEGDCPQEYVISRTWTAEDECGNVSTAVQTISVKDNTAPELTCVPMTINLRDNGIYILSQGDIRDLVGSVSDNCSAQEDITITVSPRSFSCAHAGQAVPVTVTATDECGNTIQCQTTVTVIDNLAPVINCPEDMIVSTDEGTCSAVVEFEAEVSDNCEVTTTYSHTSGSEFPLGTTTVTVSATDASGNSAECSFNITVIDNIAPVIECPENITVRLEEGSSTAEVEFSVIASDNCEFSLDYSHQSGSEFPLGTTTVSVTATDLAGNSAECSFTISVVDENAPVIICPDDISVSTDEGQCHAVVNFEANVSDITDVTIEYSHEPGSEFPVGITTVTVTATDLAGNSSACSFDVTVSDDENPVITCAGNMEVVAEPGQCEANVTVPAPAELSDNCEYTYMNDFNNTTDASGVYPLGTTMVTWSITDNSGNSASCSMSVTVIAGPVANDDVALTLEDTPVEIDVLANDTDCSNSIDPGTVSITVEPASGEISIDVATGVVTYIPGAGFNGSDTFTYSVCNENTLCDEAVVTISVAAVNRPPVAIDDINVTLVNTPVTGWVITNDYDPDGDELLTNTTPVSGPENGVLILNANGSYNYTPNFNFTGKDYFEYQICDPDGLCDTALVTVTVIPAGTSGENRPPVAIEDIYSGIKDTPVFGNLLSNDFDPDGDKITITSTPVSAPTAGTLEINSDGTFTYFPENGFTGQVTFIYEICDNGTPTLCATAAVSIDIRDVGGANTTVAVDDAFYTYEDVLMEGDVSENDYDPEGDNQVNFNLIVPPANGTMALFPNGTFEFTPYTGFTGNDFFVYEVCDDGDPVACDRATAYIVVDDAPVDTIPGDDDELEPEDCELFIPEGFSPNYDGINDNFEILCIEKYPNAKLEVYNRWGNLLYEKENYGNPDAGSNDIWWDGSSNKKWTVGKEKLPPGTYFYILYLNDGSEPRTGSVFLNRSR
jgi:gliding motility-associated-like protein